MSDVRWVLNHAKFGTRPWDVQAEGMRRSQGRSHYGYFLEQGLGKTALTLNDFAVDDSVDLMVVVAPNSFKLDWTYAPKDWGLDYKTGMWPKDPLPEKYERAVYAINYEAMRDSAFRPLEQLFKKRRVQFTIDESSALKHFGSSNSAQTFALAKRATKVRELNGTPMTQSVMDYFMQLKCLMELDGWTPKAFRNRYAVEEVGFKGIKKIVGMKNEDELSELLSRCVFRALKEDWRKDLPPRVFVPMRLEMTNKQLKHYNEMLHDFMTVCGDVEALAKLVLTQQDKLRQISSGLIMQDGKVEWLDKPMALPKVRACLDIMDGYGKTIVVYNYRPTGEMLLETFKEQGFNPAVLRGQMKPEHQREEKRRFNEDDDCRVILAQEAAACMGHDLLGSKGANRATKMTFFENSFNLRDRLQMLDRNHRGEADQECTVYDLVTSEMEETVIEALVAKKDQADIVDDLVRFILKRAT